MKNLIIELQTKVCKELSHRNQKEAYNAKWTFFSIKFTSSPAIQIQLKPELISLLSFYLSVPTFYRKMRSNLTKQ